MIIGHATRGRLRLPCHILPLSAALARSISCSANGLAAKPDCCGDIPVDVLPPAPGTVAPYAHHIFIRTPPEATDGQQLGAWWPPVVERSAGACSFQCSCGLSAVWTLIAACKTVHAGYLLFERRSQRLLPSRRTLTVRMPGMHATCACCGLTAFILNTHLRLILEHHLCWK